MRVSCITSIGASWGCTLAIAFAAHSDSELAEAREQQHEGLRAYLGFTRCRGLT